MHASPKNRVAFAYNFSEGASKPGLVPFGLCSTDSTASSNLTYSNAPKGAGYSHSFPGASELFSYEVIGHLYLDSATRVESVMWCYPNIDSLSRDGVPGRPKSRGSVVQP